MIDLGDFVERKASEIKARTSSVMEAIDVARSEAFFREAEKELGANTEEGVKAVRLTLTYGYADVVATGDLK